MFTGVGLKARRQVLLPSMASPPLLHVHVLLMDHASSCLSPSHWAVTSCASRGPLLEIPGFLKQSTEHILLLAPVSAFFGLSLCSLLQGELGDWLLETLPKAVMCKGKGATLCTQFMELCSRHPELLRPQAEQP